MNVKVWTLVKIFLFLLIILAVLGLYHVVTREQVIIMDKDKEFENKFENLIFVYSQRQLDVFAPYENMEVRYVHSGEDFLSWSKDRQVYVMIRKEFTGGEFVPVKRYIFIHENIFVTFISYKEVVVTPFVYTNSYGDDDSSNLAAMILFV